MGDANSSLENIPINPHLSERFVSKIYTIDHTLPKRRNYGIRVTRSDDGISIMLYNAGHQFNLRSLLPPDYSFAIEDADAYNAHEHLAKFDPESLQYKGSILSILHEIGHTITHRPHPVRDLPSLKRNMLILEASKRVVHAKIPKLRPQALEGLAYEMLVPERYVKKVLDHRSSQERDAWAVAIIMAKRLEKEGFNVLGEFNNLRDIQTFVAAQLSTHKYATEFVQKLLGDTTTPGLFTKRPLKK